MAELSLIINNLKNNEYKSLLKDIYVDNDILDYQTGRYISAVEMFGELYGNGNVSIFSGPGRSEICGNHTDHQHGQILAAAVNLDAIAVVQKLDEPVVKVISGDSDQIVIDLCKLEMCQEEKGTTKALIKGVLKGLENNGYKTGGFQAYITSDVMIGAGLSSSASFETIIGTIVSHMYNNGKLDAITNAVVGQYAENIYFGKPCGLMDQMACSVGNLVHVDFACKEKPVVRKIEFDIDKYGYSLCITDTKGSHADLTNDYAAVPEEMKSIASYFGQDVLLGLTADQIYSEIDGLRDKCGDRAVLRALHFINENKRVADAVDAIENNDIEKVLTIIKTSGNSSFKYLQNVYTNSDICHQNVSIALAISESMLSDGKGVCRVHGGGFAGTIQAFVKNEFVQEYKTLMNSIFGDNSCNVLKIRKYGGIKVID